MTHYGDAANIRILTSPISTEISDELLDYALNVADKWVDTKNVDTTMEQIGVAAELYATSFIYGVLYDTSEEASPIGVKYEKEAEKLITSLTNPYSSSKTPNGDYLRTVETLATNAPANNMDEEKRNLRKIMNRDQNTW